VTYGATPLAPAGSLAREAFDGEFLAKWGRAAIKDLEAVDPVAQARERAARRSARSDSYDGPEVV
jgi:hypothetical protein